MRLKIFCLSAVLVILTGCDSEPVKHAETSETIQALIDDHASEISSNHEGVYKGTIPEDTINIETVIVLTENTFEMTETKGKTVIETKGFYDRDKSTGIVTFNNARPVVKFKVDKDKIILLDENGNFFDDHADRYTLQKTE